jgi:hypothetical protein
MFDDLVKYVYGNFHVHSVKFCGHTFTQWSSPEYTRQPRNFVPQHDKDFPCEWKSTHRCPTPLYSPTPFVRVVYNIVRIESKQETYRYRTTIDSILDHMESAWADIRFLGIDMIEFINVTGRVNGHRGKNHCAVNLPFYESYIASPAKFANIWDALFKIKSHVFDTKYERFTGITNLSTEKNGSLTKVTLYVSFNDYNWRKRQPVMSATDLVELDTYN